MKSEVKQHRKICQQQCKFEIQEKVINEDILLEQYLGTPLEHGLPILLEDTSRGDHELRP